MNEDLRRQLLIATLTLRYIAKRSSRPDWAENAETAAGADSGSCPTLKPWRTTPTSPVLKKTTHA